MLAIYTIKDKNHQNCCKSQSEIEDEVFYYVMDRPLHRPKINLFCAIAIFLADVCLSLAIGCLLSDLISVQGYIPLIFVLVFIHTLRFLGIVFVKCYQHHAPEEMRRRCLCKPTCSEYAIICFKKYIFVYALFKICRRLFKICKGMDYKIDLP